MCRDVCSGSQLSSCRKMRTGGGRKGCEGIYTAVVELENLLDSSAESRRSACGANHPARRLHRLPPPTGLRLSPATSTARREAATCGIVCSAPGQPFTGLCGGLMTCRGINAPSIYEGRSYRQAPRCPALQQNSHKEPSRHFRYSGLGET